MRRSKVPRDAAPAETLAYFQNAARNARNGAIAIGLLHCGEGGITHIERIAPLLHAHELERADAMQASRRHQFMAARGLAQSFLRAAGLGRAQAALAIGEYGRPGLDQGTGLDINLSHSGALIAVALSNAGRVGVDVEAGRIECPKLARKILTAEEAKILDTLDVCSHTEVFRHAWVVKEAISKADGRGLVAMNMFSTDFRLASRREAIEWQTLLTSPEFDLAVALIREPGCARWRGGDVLVELSLSSLLDLGSYISKL